MNVHSSVSKALKFRNPNPSSSPTTQTHGGNHQGKTTRSLYNYICALYDGITVNKTTISSTLVPPCYFIADEDSFSASELASDWSGWGIRMIGDTTIGGAVVTPDEYQTTLQQFLDKFPTQVCDSSTGKPVLLRSLNPVALKDKAYKILIGLTVLVAILVFLVDVVALAVILWNFHKGRKGRQLKARTNFR